MANVDGSWNTVTKSPMGDQQAVLTVQSAGDSFTGNFSGGLGTTDIKDGTVNGDTLTARSFTIFGDNSAQRPGGRSAAAAATTPATTP